MQANDGKDNNEGREDGGGEDEEKETTNEEGKEESQNEDKGTNEEEGDGATTTTTSDPGEETAAAPARVLPLNLIVPTKTYDGGLNNEQAAQVQSQVQAVHHQSGETETTAAAESNTPDLFQVYSDTDTRMRTLLGIEQSNPNDAEADWRQLTGFQGIRDEELRRNNNDGGDYNGTTPRRTRVTTELHSSAFDHMFIGELGELDLNELGGLDLDELLRRLQALQQEEENDGHELDELLRRLQVRQQQEENDGHELDEDRQQQGGR